MKRLKDVHPAVWIGMFFAILIAANVTFYAIALQQPDDYIPPSELGAPGGGR